MNNIIKLALKEDIGTGDVSANLLEDKQVSASIISREKAIICGLEYVLEVFLQVDKTIKVKFKVKDGDSISKNQVICSLVGSVKSIVTAERVALNFLQTLSSTSTQTRYLTDKIKHTNTKLLDTRKTIPGLRVAQKYAVKCGRGVNHRSGLYDTIMLKENHISANGDIANIVKKAQKKYPDLPIIVEVENLKQLKEVLMLKGLTRVLCDNFSINKLASAVTMTKGIYPLEASGNINEDNIVKIANTGVDYISVGAITKNIRAIDFSLRFL